jgi:hypothetical protein
MDRSFCRMCAGALGYIFRDVGGRTFFLRRKSTIGLALSTQASRGGAMLVGVAD